MNKHVIIISVILFFFIISGLHAQNESYTFHFDIQFNKTQFIHSIQINQKARRLASVIGRSATAYAQQRGSENPLTIVVIAAPEKSAFNTPIYPGVAVFMKMK